MRSLLSILGLILLAAVPQDPKPRRDRLSEEDRAKLGELSDRGDRKALVQFLSVALGRKGVGKSQVEDYLSFVLDRAGTAVELAAAWEQVLLAARPTVGGALFLARLHELAHQPGDSQRVLEEAVKEFPNEACFRFPLGRARMGTGQFKAATPSLEAELASSAAGSDTLELRIALAECYVRTGRNDAAVAQIRAAETKETRVRLARESAELKLHGEAIRLLRQVQQEGMPNPGPLRLAIARSLRDMGKPDEAGAEYLDLLKLFPEFATQVSAEYFPLLSEQGQGAGIAKALLVSYRRSGDEQRGCEVLSRMSSAVPEKERETVLAAWGTAAGEKSEDQAAVSFLIVSWAPSHEKALALLRRAEAKAPDSLRVLLEIERILNGSPRPQEMAPLQERLAGIDPEGKSGGRTASARRLIALQNYLGLKKTDDAARLGLQLVLDPAATAGQRSEARKALSRGLVPLHEAGWQDLKKLRIPAATEEETRRVKKLILQLGDDDFDRRKEAQRELHKIGGPALPQLLPLTDHDDVDLRSNVRSTIEAILLRDP